MTGRISLRSGIVLVELFLAACAPEQATPSNTATVPPPPATATIYCEQELVPPQITEIQPLEPMPGSEIWIIGSGGFIQDTCGGTIEGSRTFKLYLDSQPVGKFSCYVNHCEGKLTLSGTLPTGPHCLSAETEICQFEFQTGGSRGN